MSAPHFRRRTTVDLQQLSGVLETMLSPLTAPSREEWVRGVIRSLRIAVGGAQAISVLPGERERPLIVGDQAHPLMMEWLAPRLRAAPASPASDEKINGDWESGDETFDLGWRRRRAAAAFPDVPWTSDMLERATPEPFRRTAFYHEVWIPTDVDWAFGLSALGRAELAVAFADRRHAKVGSDPKPLLRLLLPAWRAGYELALRLDAWRSGVPAVVDALGLAVAMMDDRGRVVHRSPAFASMCDTRPHADQPSMVDAASQLALQLNATARSPRRSVANGALLDFQGPSRVIRVGSRQVRLRAALLPSGLIPAGGGAGTAIVADWIDAQPLDADAICRATPLSRREAEVARLLAEGFNNLRIAGALGCSSHTARHHTEHVLTKLGVRSRHKVRECLDRALERESR